MKTIPLLAQLPPGEIKPLISDNQLYLKSYLKGARFYNQNDSCKTFDIVLSGS
jgi:hypothetical protein